MDLKMDNLEDYVYSILGSAKKDFKAGRILWLEGFNAIIQNSILDEDKFEQVSEYSNSRSSRTTGLIFPKFYQKNKTKIDEEILIPAYLNLDSDFHLAFWTENFSSEDDDFCRILYSNESYGHRYDRPYPLMELRLNQLFSDSSGIPLRIDYDGRKVNTYDIFDEKTNPEILISAYDQMNRIISSSKVETKSSRKRLET